MILPNLRRVTHAEFHYRNNTGQQVDSVPKEPTHLGIVITPEYAEYLHKLGYRPDIWTAELILHMGNGKVLTFLGDRALSLWDSYKGVVFNSSK